MARGADVITYEWEGVPAATARALESIAPVYPPPGALDVAQDRVVEKNALRALGIANRSLRRGRLGRRPARRGRRHRPPRRPRRRGAGVTTARGRPCCGTAADVDGAWAALGAVPSILEGFVPFDRELSIIAVRGRDGEVACWPAVENHHRDGILRLTRAPAPGLDDALQARAEAAIRPLLTDLDYVGVCCVELFDVGGDLLANEIAPRGAQLRALDDRGRGRQASSRTTCARSSDSPSARPPRSAPSAMVNCIATMPDRDAVLAIPGAHLHDYGKSPRAGRKLGHVTVTAPDGDQLEAAARTRCASYATAPVSRSFATSAAAMPQSASASSVCWPGHGAERCTSPAVREKRGAGAGCGTPSRSMIVWRAFMCASLVASLIVSTGA